MMNHQRGSGPGDLLNKLVCILCLVSMDTPARTDVRSHPAPVMLSTSVLGKAVCDDYAGTCVFVFAPAQHWQRLRCFLPTDMLI